MEDGRPVLQERWLNGRPSGTGRNGATCRQPSNLPYADINSHATSVRVLVVSDRGPALLPARDAGACPIILKRIWEPWPRNGDHVARRRSNVSKPQGIDARSEKTIVPKRGLHFRSKGAWLLNEFCFTPQFRQPDPCIDIEIVSQDHWLERPALRSSALDRRCCRSFA